MKSFRKPPSTSTADTDALPLKTARAQFMKMAAHKVCPPVK